MFNNMYKGYTVKSIFLTLIPEQVPTGSNFINIMYKDIIREMNIQIEDDGLNRLYQDFLEVIDELVI